MLCLTTERDVRSKGYMLAPGGETKKAVKDSLYMLSQMAMHQSERCDDLVLHVCVEGSIWLVQQ